MYYHTLTVNSPEVDQVGCSWEMSFSVPCCVTASKSYYKFPVTFTGRYTARNWKRHCSTATDLIYLWTIYSQGMVIRLSLHGIKKRVRKSLKRSVHTRNIEINCVKINWKSRRNPTRRCCWKKRKWSTWKNNMGKIKNKIPTFKLLFCKFVFRQLERKQKSAHSST